VTRTLEILGTTVSVPDPGAATALSASFGEMSGSLADAHDTLQTLTRPDAWGVWTGQAADAFGQSVGKLPAELGDIRDAYGAVSAALREYAAELEPVVNALTALASRADEAEGTLTATRNARQHAIAQGHDPHTTGWDARLVEATAVVSSQRAQLERLISELDGLATTCTKRITAAEPRQAKKSLFGELASDFMRDVADPLGRGIVAFGHAEADMAGAVLAGGITLGKDALKVGEIAGKGLLGIGAALFVHPFTDLPHDLSRYLSDPTAANLGSVLGDVAGILGVAALLVPGADLFVAGALVVNAGAAAADWTAVAEHEDGASVLDAGLATVGLGLGGVSFVAGRAVDADTALGQHAFDDGDWQGLEDLKNGDDARASAATLWQDGVSQRFSLTDVKASLSDSVHQVLHLGDDGFTHSPAAVKIEHIKWSVDRPNDVVTYIEDKRKHAQHP